jgi:hypothetical protein
MNQTSQPRPRPQPPYISRWASTSDGPVERNLKSRRKRSSPPATANRTITADECVSVAPRHRRRETYRPLHLVALLALGVAINMEAWGVSAPLALATVVLVLGIALLGRRLSRSRVPGPSGEDPPVR